MHNPKKNQPQWDVPADKEKGIYSNIARIQSSAFDFVIDFGRNFPGNEKASLESRIVMTPEHVGMFLEVLQKHYAEYQKNKKGKQNPPSGWYFDDFRR